MQSSYPHAHILLASQSPRRSQILDQMGVPHHVRLPPDSVAAEALEAVLSGEAAVDYVQRVVTLKLAHAQAAIVPSSEGAGPAVLCADTTVALDGAILGKPVDAQDAIAILSQLSGRQHQVYTAVGLHYQGRSLYALSRSTVQFARLESAQIARYVASGETAGKAGAYGIQGAAGNFIQHIEGSYSGIMGLPMFETAQLLRTIAYPI